LKVDDSLEGELAYIFIIWVSPGYFPDCSAVEDPVSSLH
jgi:hypothetical protein